MREMAVFLTSLSDIRKDSEITYVINPNPIDNVLSKKWWDSKPIDITGDTKVIYDGLKDFFPNLDVMIPPLPFSTIDKFHKDLYFVLYTMEQLHQKDGHTIRTINTDTVTTDDILEILKNRQYVAHLISTLGPQMKPMSSLQEDQITKTRMTRYKRFLTYLFNNMNKITENLRNTVLSMNNKSKFTGGKTQKKFYNRISKTRRKRYVTKTFQMKTRKKYQKSNRSKKNKTLRKTQI